jgi:hypothetical protein
MLLGKTVMKKLTALSYVALCVIALPLGMACHAEEVRKSMNSLLLPFKAIQPYIASQEKFTAPENREAVFSVIQDLRKNFHTLESVPSSFHKLPGFDENLSAATDLLDDTSRRFQEGKVSYAWWRVRKLPSDCFTCHATYKVSSRYSNPGVIDETLDPLNKGRFLLATRQFKEAQDQFLLVLKDRDSRLYFNEALRSLLLISIRIDKDPLEGVARLKQVLNTSDLPEEDAREAKNWIRQLTAWSKEKPARARDTVAFAEQLITAGAVSSPTRAQDDVALLRGTAILHTQLEQGTIRNDARPRALYLLGFAYTKLPLFFSESWAEMYLERCIKEFPGTVTAKQAFSIYRDQIVDDYTGTAGTNIPAEVQLHLEELRKKAHGEPQFKGVVKAPHPHSSHERS